MNVLISDDVFLILPNSLLLLGKNLHLLHAKPSEQDQTVLHKQLTHYIDLNLKSEERPGFMKANFQTH